MVKQHVRAFTGVARTGAWFALALVGQASALQLVDAGPTVRYQHYATPELLVSPERIVFLVIVLIQTLICAAGVVTRWPVISGWIRPRFSSWKLVFIGAVFVLASAALSRSIVSYAFELILATLVQLAALISVLMAVMALPNSSLERFWRRATEVLGPHADVSGPTPLTPDRFALAPAVIVTLVAAILSVASYERHPHVPDEVAYVLNAKYFAAGLLYMPAPPVPAAFDVDLMHMTPGQWFSPMPPGWPAILAIGERLNVAWLVNPVLAGVNVILTYLFLREIYARRTARLSTLLLCVSPWYLFMGMNLMTHMLSLTAALAGAVAVARLLRTGRLYWALMGGGAVGILSLTRPLEGLLMLVLLSAWTLTSRAAQLRILGTAVLMAGGVVVGALALPYNKTLTGRMTELPLTTYVSARYGSTSNDLGFGPDRGWGWTGLDPFPGHDALDAAINAALNLFSVNVELFGWGAGSLVFILALISARLSPSDYRMVAAILAVLASLSLYWFSGGPDFGARYWFLMIVPLVALTARGIEAVGFTHTPDSREFPVGAARALAAAAIFCAVSLVTFVPWRAIDKYHHYRGMRPDVRELAKQFSFDRSLVLVEGQRHPDFASAAAYEPISLDANAPIYAWARTPEIAAKVRAAFPGRPVWLLQGPSVTGDGYKVSHRPPKPTSDTR